MVRGSFSSIIVVVCWGVSYYLGGILALSMVTRCEAAFGSGRIRMTSRYRRSRSSPIQIRRWSSSSEDVVVTTSEELNESSKEEAAVMGGVAEFEQWFTTLSSSFASGNNQSSLKKMKQVTHAAFDGVRGLQYLGEQPFRQERRTEKKRLQTLLTVPSSMVFQTSFDSGWDVRLATQLLQECAKGRKSSFYGYCSLLMRGDVLDRESGMAPPSTAPDALRNWDPEQRQPLTQSSKGAKLLEAQQRQEERWRAAHENTLNDSKEQKKHYSLEQFVWAMEAVHSRAFSGDFGTKLPFKAWAGILTPVAAGAIGFNFLLQDYSNGGDATGGGAAAAYGPVSQNNGIATACAVIAFLPVLLNFVADKMESGTNNPSNSNANDVSAVLLPLIDSANHVPTAESRLEFDPLEKTFSVSIDPNTCIDAKTQQLFINYGTKTDVELLLNYGFLPNSSSPNNPMMLDSSSSTSNNDNDPNKRDAQRAALAKAFVQQNP